MAVVGSGVCGLTCAHDLALLGYTVEVFESAPVPGGMLYLGIPHFRLPREIIKMEVDNILALGVKLHTRMTLGRDVTLAQLQSRFNAVLLATGPEQRPGAEHSRVRTWMECSTASIF